MPTSPPPQPHYAYLGPTGTFTEQALLTLPGLGDVTHTPCATVPAALDLVRAGAVGGAVVPIENSVEGSVPVTLDELATGEPLTIRREVTVPVSFSLLVRPGTTLSDVRRVGTHPHAAAQTRRWLAAHLPDAQVVNAASTASAAADLAEGTPEWDAAVSAPLAGRRYGLEALHAGIGDNVEAVTRFVVVGPPGRPPAATGADKTSLVAFIHDDHPGALLELLEEFSLRGVNLTRIESRPTGGGLGRYHFSIDCEGHLDDYRVGEALMGLRRTCADVRWLGSYPREDGVRTDVRRGTFDEDFRDAEAWLARLRTES